MTATGVAYCWGRNASGQLGDNTTVDRSNPVPVAGGLTFVSISTGETNSCGLAAAGKAYCWGYGPALGDGVGLSRSVPTAVAGNLTFKYMVAGGFASWAMGLARTEVLRRPWLAHSRSPW